MKTPAAGLLYGLAFAALALFAFGQAASPILYWGLWSTLLAALVLAAAAAAGRKALAALKLREAGEGGLTALGAALGLGALAYAALGLGSLGLLSTGSALALVGVLAVLGHGQYRAAWASLRDELSSLPAAALAGAGLLAAALAVVAWAPPHQYDSLVYHLAEAETYARTGRVAPIPGLLYSAFPQNGEMLFTLALLLGSDVTAQLFCAAATLLTAFLVWTWARREWPAAPSALAVLLYLSQTAVLLLGSTSYVEPLVALWLTAALLCFERWWDAPLEVRAARRWLVLSGVFCGVAFGTKYYAGLAPALLALFLLLRLSREPKAALQHLALFAGAALVPALPWLLKNAVTIGNPVFPFFFGWFPHRGVEWSADTARRYFHVLTEYRSAGLARELAEFPRTLLLKTTRFGGGMDVLGDLGWILPFAAVPLYPLSLRRSALARFLAAYLACHFLGWLATGVVLRFLTVVAPLFALLAAHGLWTLWSGVPASRPFLALGGAAFLATRLFLAGYVQAVFEVPGVLLGQESQAEFLARRLAYYPCARWATESAGKNDKVLVVGEQRAYYLHADHLATSVFEKNLFESEAEAASGPDDLARRLKADGFTMLLYVPSEARRLTDYGGSGLFKFEGRAAAWEGFLSAQKPEFSAAGCWVSRL